MTTIGRGIAILSLGALLLLGHSCINAQERAEITQQDLTKIVKLRSTEVCVFGIYLGESTAELPKRAESAGLRIVSRPPGIDFYEGAKEVLSISVDGDKVSKIHLFSAVSSHLAGNASHLWDDEIAQRASYLRRSLLGREDETTVEQTSIGKVTSFVYGKEGILITCSNAVIGSYRSTSIVVHFVASEKARQ